VDEEEVDAGVEGEGDGIANNGEEEEEEEEGEEEEDDDGAILQ
jgi:hypothetical protein